jgi:PAS domain S-box-containing protein
VAWLTLGIASVALALIAVVVLRSERESTAILQHMNLISLSLQNVLSDLAGAEAEQRGYFLTGRPTNLENLQRSRQVLGLEFQRLTALVKNNPAQRQEVERVRHLVEQDLDELQRSIPSHMAAGSQVAFVEILTDRARKLTEALRQTITGIGEENEGVLARLARERRTRLARALVAVSSALFLAACYVLMAQTMIARSESRRQQTEAALRESENRFKTLCDQAPVGIYSTDAHGLCVYANPRWSQMSGLSADESLGHGWTKALHPDDSETVFESWKTNAQQGASWEYRLLTPQGEIRWIRALGGPIYSDRGEVSGYVGTTEDITEPVLAYRALQERDALNRAILNSLPANIAVLKGDGTIQGINEEWRRFAEANGDPPASFVNPGVNYLEACKRAADGGSSDGEKALTGIQDVLAGKLQSFRMQYPCHSPTEKRWFHMVVTPLTGVTTGGVVVTHSDITERKRADDAVQEALEQLQLITDNMSAGVVRVSSDLRYVWVNPNYAALMGRAKEEIAGRRIIDVIGKEVYEDIWPHIEKVLRGERGQCEIQAALPGAGRRWIHAVYAPTTGQDHNIDGYISVVADVTERHEAEERLRESEERFRNMADTAPVLIWGSGPDKLCTFFNKVWLDFTGRALEQELGNGWAEGVHPDDVDRCLAVYSSSFNARQSFQMEYRLQRADGTYRWLLDSGVPRFTSGGVFEGYIGSCVDVTDFKKAQERFRLVVEASPTAIVMVDGKGKIALVNSRTEKLFGYGRQELAGQPVEILVAESLRDTHQTLRNKFLLQPIARPMGKGLDLSGRRKDGTEFPVEIGLAPIETEDGSCVLSSIVDISERKLAEERLRESEERFRAIFYQAAVGMSQTSIDGEWMLLNDQLCEILGYSRDELVGKKFYDFTHPDDREASLAAVRKLLAGEISSSLIEKRYIRKDGVTVRVKVYMSLVPHNEARYLVRVVEDITERILAQEKLRESEERFRTMADAAPVMIWLTGLDKSCIFLNKVWLDFTGRTMEQESGYGWVAGVHPDDRDRCLAIYSSSFEARRSFQLEYRLRRADGEYRWLLDNGVPRFAISGVFEGYIGSCIDITERKYAEELKEELQRERERLAEARGLERFRLSFEEAPVGMALIRGDGVWLRVNRALCQMTGYDESELISRAGDITHPDDRAEESRLRARILSGELAAGRLEERYLHKQRHTIYVLLSIAAVDRDDAGRPVHFVAHVEDLTERKRVEQELEASRAQMVSSSRLSALGMMAGGIAHEINNPLAVIHASAANIIRMSESGSVQVPPAVLKNNHRISQTADRISRIVRSLRHVARESSADEFRETPVREIVDETLELCTERFRAHNIRLSVPVVDPKAIVNSREAQICQVLLNLLQNAFDELVDLEGERWVVLDVTYCPGWVVLSVSDSGPGIGPEHRAHIMEPFFTTKPVGKGTGLGLSISRSIALQHGGTLELDEESPHTCFRLKLPLSQRT